MRELSLFICVSIFTVACGWVIADDWPTYQHDNARSGITTEQLKIPLNEAWVYKSRYAPQPAWPPPAKTDFWHEMPSIRAKVTYDQAFHLVSVGDLVYFSSSADDKVYCLDALTGEERWAFFTEGPVRLAPTFWKDRVYFGSDDGYVYCLKARDGKLDWKYSASPEDRRIPGNGRIISTWPVRSGVLVDNDIAYFCAGLFPGEGVYVCALDAKSGREIWKTKHDLSPQGYLLASTERLYVPMGRVAPAVLSRQEGKLLGILDCPRAEGGTYALLSGDILFSGPGTQLTAFHATERDRIATFNGYMIIADSHASYLLSDNELSAIDRAAYAYVAERRAGINTDKAGLAAKMSELRNKLSGQDIEAADKQISKEIADLDKKLAELDGKEYRWRIRLSSTYYSMVLAGDILFMGGDGLVEALHIIDGRQVWNGKVDGKAYGMAVANGRLLVSTDRGVIYCFGGAINLKDYKAKQSDDSPEYPTDELAKTCALAARNILQEADVKKGYCLVLGCENGCLAYELAKVTDLKIVCIEDDGKKVAKVRKLLDAAGLYGVRVSVHQGNLESLPYTDYFANLIVSEQMMGDGEIPCPVPEILRVLRPYGGAVYIGASQSKKFTRAVLESRLNQAAVPGWSILEKDGIWAIMRRGALPGSGEWTHAYADVGNTACSGDNLIYGATRVQWFGEPGPRPMLDRHHRAPVPLFKDGRLFVPGDDRIIAVDAYNGNILWDTEVPRFRRVGSNRDSSNMVVTDDYLYVTVEDKCLGLNIVTGQPLLILKVPQLIMGSDRHWGYTAVVGDLLFGSGRKVGAIYNETSKSAVYDLSWGDFKQMITSDYLFCMNRHNGEVIWTYKSGIIINPAITIGGGRLYFVESHDPRALADDDGKIELEKLLSDGADLVALNLQNGKTVWKQRVDLSFCQHQIYLSYAKDILLITGSKNKDNSAHYYLQTFDANSGSPMWQKDHGNNVPGIGGDHGEQIHHPAIVGDIIYAEPCAYSLKTGIRVNTDGMAGQWTMPRRKGCGTISASSYCLFYRDHQPVIYDLRPGGGLTKLSYVTRLGCWINAVPAGGLVLTPEASSGCTCSYPLQTSMAFLPKGDAGL